MMSLRTLYIFEGRREDVARRFPSVNVNSLASKDPSGPQLKYLEWMAKQVNAGVKVEDIVPSVEYFHRNQVRFDRKDINAYRTAKDLEDTVKDISSKTSGRQEIKLAKQDAEKIWEDGESTLIFINSRKAAQIYGKGTKWCITMHDTAFFEHYDGAGVVFYFLIRKQPKNDPMDKVAFAIMRDRNNQIVKERCQYFDAQDHLVNPNKFSSEALDVAFEDAKKKPKSLIQKIRDGESTPADEVRFFETYKLGDNEEENKAIRAVVSDVVLRTESRTFFEKAFVMLVNDGNGNNAGHLGANPLFGEQAFDAVFSKYGVNSPAFKSIILNVGSILAYDVNNDFSPEYKKKIISTVSENQKLFGQIFDLMVNRGIIRMSSEQFSSYMSSFRDFLSGGSANNSFSFIFTKNKSDEVQLKQRVDMVDLMIEMMTDGTANYDNISQMLIALVFYPKNKFLSSLAKRVIEKVPVKTLFEYITNAKFHPFWYTLEVQKRAEFFFSALLNKKNSSPEEIGHVMANAIKSHVMNTYQFRNSTEGWKTDSRDLLSLIKMFASTMKHMPDSIRQIFAAKTREMRDGIWNAYAEMRGKKKKVKRPDPTESRVSAPRLSRVFQSVPSILN